MESKLQKILLNYSEENLIGLDQLDKLIFAYINEQKDQPYFYNGDLKDSKIGAQISILSQTDSALVAQKITDLLLLEIQNSSQISYNIAYNNCFWLLKNLLKKNLPLKEDNIINLLHIFYKLSDVVYSCPKGILVNFIVKFISKNSPSDTLQEAIKKYIDFLRDSNSWGSENIKLADKLDSALGVSPTVTIIPNEAWSDQFIADFDNMTENQKISWAGLLSFGATMSGTKPSAKWEKQALILLDEIGINNFIEYFLKWTPLVDKPNQENSNHLSIINIEILKGMTWYCKYTNDVKITRAITALAFSTLKKIPGHGPRAVKVGNACINVLGELKNFDALGQLALLKVRIKFKPAQKAIENAITNIAARTNIPREEIEEMGVPAYGMEEVGVRREVFGEYTAELKVTGTNSTEITWLNANTKMQKSTPKIIMENFKDDFKELKDANSDILKMLPAQRDRIDNLFLCQKSWDYLIWKERYIDHPLVGILSRRIIWQFKFRDKEIAVIFHEGKFVNYIDETIEPNSDVKVNLWHPIEKPIDDVLGWRDWLFKHNVTQPFKQAHREVYLLTNAEKKTVTYSNRFASHIIKQHQFNALCGARGWKNQLRLSVDAEFEPAHINLPIWNLRAEFWVEGIGEEINEAGTFIYLSTDQVRFYRIDAIKNHAHASGGGYGAFQNECENDKPLPLESIPPIVLSEVLRDVDLFVGVTSVGNDPTWSDGGRDGRFIDYWQKYSFDNLTESAKTRKNVLEKLVPKLKIAKQCSFDNKFLIVKGEIRTYKIHLGSGNILMEPNDQYLCIVANQVGKKGENVMLPFEGDRTMSIILSKAFLLAEDKNITDQSIVNQLQKGT